MILSNDTFAYAILKTDRYFNRLNTSQIEFLIEKSTKLGFDVAHEFFGKLLIEELEEQNVKIVFREETHPAGIFSQIQLDRKKSEIQIFLGSMERKRQAYINIVREPISLDQMIQIHLMHEFYHFIELSKERRTEELVGKVAVMGFGGMKQRLITSISEIAAHAFAFKYGNLSHHPLLMDYALLFEQQNKPVEQVEEYINQIQCEYERRILYGTNIL